MTDRLMPWHYPPDDPGFWDTKKMEKKTYVVKLSVLIEVTAHNRDDADERATVALEWAIVTSSSISDIETVEVEEV